MLITILIESNLAFCNMNVSCILTNDVFVVVNGPAVTVGVVKRNLSHENSFLICF